MGKTLKCVLGFFFDGTGNVALVKKNSPAWQNGRLNGIGGKIEEGETPLQTMIREFREEAGAVVNSWRQFCVMTGDGYRMYCFTAKEATKINPNTDEGIIDWYPVNNLPDNILPNALFLIPMANYKYAITAKIIHKNPQC